MRSRRALVLSLALAACASRPPPDPAPATGAAADAGAGADAAAVAVPLPLRTDPLWRAARERDPLDLERLAMKVGEGELASAFEGGGDDAEVALLALPYAEDSELALAKLAEAALRSPSDPLLRSILGVAGRPRTQREPLDPDGAASCFDAMVMIAEDPKVPSSLRSIAVSAPRALVERGFGDRARVPTDLDAPATKQGELTKRGAPRWESSDSAWEVRDRAWELRALDMKLANSVWERRDRAWEVREHRWELRDLEWALGDSGWELRDRAWELGDSAWKSRDFAWELRDHAWELRDHPWELRDLAARTELPSS